MMYTALRVEEGKMLGNYLPPFEDEMLLSWFSRLARLNGIDNVKTFLQAFVYPHKKEKFIPLSYSCTNQCLRYFCEQTECSPYDLFVKHTEYPAVAPFLTDYRQTQVLLAVFGKPMGSKSINRFIKRAQVCAACQKEMPYIRVSHNLPGVRACWKHGCSLDGAPVTVEDVTYARYAHEFLTAKIDCNIKQLMKFAGQRGVRLTMHIGFEKGIRALMPMISVAELKDKLNGNDQAVPAADYTVLQGYGAITEFCHDTCGTKFCMNANGFNLGFQCPTCQKKMTDAERFQNYVDHVGGYELLTPYEGLGEKVALRHSKCGRVMEIKAFHFLEGNRCTCNYYHTPAEIQETIRRFGNFKLLAYKKERVTILHEDCGQRFTVGYKKFLARPWCKKCNPRFLRSEETLQTEIKVISPDFEYVGGFTGSTSSFTIRHKCGCEFQRGIYEFRKNPTCPRCSKLVTGARRTQFIGYMAQKVDKTVTIKEMQEYSGISYDAAKRELHRLVESGIAAKAERGKYRLERQV